MGSRFFITPKELFWRFENDKKKSARPMIARKYWGKDGSVGRLTCKQNDQYYITKVFAKEETHDLVAETLTDEFGILVGSTFEQARDRINNTSSLNSKIDTVGMKDGEMPRVNLPDPSKRIKRWWQK